MKKKVLITLGIISVALISIIVSAWIYLDKSYNQKELDDSNLGISEDFSDYKMKSNPTEVKAKEITEEPFVEEVESDVSGIKNIALFGLDRRSTKEASTRSDSIMVLTLNYDTKEVKLTSFMRDILVNIEGYGLDKLNHSYSYGGPELAIKTLNQNFDLNIEEYVAVDFIMLEEIIENIGGIEINVKPEEIPLINKYMREIAKKNGKEYEDLVQSGLVELNGQQAVSFARIRSVGNGDYERTERQRIVLSSIIKKLSEVEISDIPPIANTILKNTETSVSKIEAVRLAKDYLSTDFSEPQTSRIPRDGSFTSGINQDTGIWEMNVDIQKEVKYLKGWIYNLE